MVKQKLRITVSGEEEIEASKVKAFFSDSSFVGTAKVYLPYQKAKWNLWNQKDAEVIINAGVNSRTIFHGTVKNPIKEQKDICVELQDYGSNFQRPYCGNYQNQTIEEVLTTLASECDYTVDLSDLSPTTLETKISRDKTIEFGNVVGSSMTATIGETVSTISGYFESSCWHCKDEYSNRFYVTAIDNKCPFCGKYNSMMVDESTKENRYLCKNCMTTFCGIDGYQTSGDRTRKLNIIAGPVEGDEVGTVPSLSSSTTTYEDEIRLICNNNNLYITLTQDNRIIIKEFRGTPLADATITLDDIFYKSYQFLTSSDQTIRKVVVKYRDGVVSSEDGTSASSDLDAIVLNHPELDQSAAKILAHQTLIDELKNIISQLFLKVLLDSRFRAGQWVQVPDPDITWTTTGRTMYISGITISIVPLQTQTATLTLKYSPKITSRTSTISGSASTPTMDQVLREAASFDYNNACQSYSCVDAKRCGDSHGISDWIYTELIKIGVNARIMAYDSPYLATQDFHFVQIRQVSTWTDIPYKKYNFNQRLCPTNVRTNLRVIK